MMGNRGAVMVEAAMILFPLLLLLVLLVEMHRRVFQEVLLHHAAFLSIRSRLWGSEHRAREVVDRFLVQAMGREGARGFRRGLSVDFGQGEECFARAYRRYPALIAFSWNGKSKHHFEVTRRCRFFCSQR